MDSEIRAADTDRERVVAQLETHVGADRLTLNEFSDRATAAYRARTIGELNLLTQDLPQPSHKPTDNRPPAQDRRRLPVPVPVVVAVVATLALLAWVFVSLNGFADHDPMGPMGPMMDHMSE